MFLGRAFVVTRLCVGWRIRWKVKSLVLNASNHNIDSGRSIQQVVQNVFRATTRLYMVVDVSLYEDRSYRCTRAHRVIVKGVPYCYILYRLNNFLRLGDVVAVTTIA